MLVGGIIVLFIIPPLGLLLTFFGLTGVIINAFRKKPKEEYQDRAIMVERVYYPKY